MPTAVMCRLIATAAMCLVVNIATIAAQEAAVPPRPRKPAPSQEQLAAWARELDADEFLTRETAMTQLLEAGPAALAALKPVLAAGSLEATSRGLFVVGQLGLSADDETHEQAGKLLAELATRDETPLLARRAAAALVELRQERTVLARTELANLGAKVSRSQIIGGFFLNEGVPTVEIGDDFRGTERDLKRLRWLTDVPVLMLTGKQATDGWLQHAAAIPGLEELHLHQTAITSAGLTPLREHATLRQLGLYYTPVGDEALPSLEKLPLLRFVKFYGTRVTAQAADKFMAASGVVVDHRRGAYLGVSGRDVEGGCRIFEVKVRSPAEKAGLAQDDEVIRFEKAPITTFGELTAAISLRDVGEDVEIEVIRRLIDNQGNTTSRNVIVKVALMPWELETAAANIRK